MKDIINDAVLYRSDTTQKKTVDKVTLLVQNCNKNPIYQAVKMIKADIKNDEGFLLHPLSVSDITLTKAKILVPLSLYCFLRWLIVNDKFE